MTISTKRVKTIEIKIGEGQIEEFKRRLAGEAMDPASDETNDGGENMWRGRKSKKKDWSKELEGLRKVKKSAEDGEYANEVLAKKLAETKVKIIELARDGEFKDTIIKSVLALHNEIKGLLEAAILKAAAKTSETVTATTTDLTSTINSKEVSDEVYAKEKADDWLSDFKEKIDTYIKSREGGIGLFRDAGLTGQKLNFAKIFLKTYTITKWQEQATPPVELTSAERQTMYVNVLKGAKITCASLREKGKSDDYTGSLYKILTDYLALAEEGFNKTATPISSLKP